MEIQCGACGAPMECNPGPECWCARLPRLPMPEDGEGCLCPSCLAKRLAEREPPDQHGTQG